MTAWSGRPVGAAGNSTLNSLRLLRGWSVQVHVAELVGALIQLQRLLADLRQFRCGEVHNLDQCQGFSLWITYCADLNKAHLGRVELALGAAIRFQRADLVGSRTSL
jgi:hypothetical protein